MYVYLTPWFLVMGAQQGMCLIRLVDGLVLNSYIPRRKPPLLCPLSPSLQELQRCDSAGIMCLVAAAELERKRGIGQSYRCDII